MADPSLAETIRRIILAPYPVTLKTLDTALRTVGSRGVKAWAASHPCQIEAIAIAIVHALEFCPYAIPVIEQMGPPLLYRLTRSHAEEDYRLHPRNTKRNAERKAGADIGVCRTLTEE